MRAGDSDTMAHSELQIRLLAGREVFFVLHKKGRYPFEAIGPVHAQLLTAASGTA